MNSFLFAATVLIWGSTWIAITMQIGPVPVVTSIFWRFALAAAVLVAGLGLAGRLRRPARTDVPFLMLQGLCLFSLNFICFYHASRFVTSGLISVIFSLSTLFNAVNARIFFGERITQRMMLAACLGVSGLILLFSRDLFGARLDQNALVGIGLGVLGTLFFSLGNMISRRNSAAGVSPVQANAWGVSFGAMVLAGITVAGGASFAIPLDARYVGALLYLSLVGSVIGFTTYLMLVARLGSSRAAYATVMFPAVALMLSSLFEGYRWHAEGIAGLALVMAGNIVVFAKPRRRLAT